MRADSNKADNFCQEKLLNYNYARDRRYQMLYRWLLLLKLFITEDSA